MNKKDLMKILEVVEESENSTEDLHRKLMTLANFISEKISELEAPPQRQNK